MANPLYDAGFMLRMEEGMSLFPAAGVNAHKFIKMANLGRSVLEGIAVDGKAIEEIEFPLSCEITPSCSETAGLYAVRCTIRDMVRSLTLQAQSQLRFESLEDLARSNEPLRVMGGSVVYSTREGIEMRTFAMPGQMVLSVYSRKDVSPKEKTSNTKTWIGGGEFLHKKALEHFDKAVLSMYDPAKADWIRYK